MKNFENQESNFSKIKCKSSDMIHNELQQAETSTFYSRNIINGNIF